jgi:hypothetical protein
MNRTGEKGVLPQRNSRFFKRDAYFYYSTREGIDIGPFDSLHEAETGASAFIDFVLHAEPQVMASLNRYSRAA